MPVSSLQRVIATSSAALVACFSLLGCSSSSEQFTKVAPSLGDGSIALTGPIPEVSAPSTTFAEAHALAFLPAQTISDGMWVSIDRRSGMVRLMQGQKELQAASADGVQALNAGTFELMHKQRNALWYAPNTYFATRGITVPAVGARERYRRGALGEFSLFIDKDTPLYSGPVWTDEIGGIRLDENLLSRMYYSLEVGAPIEVK